MVNTKKLTFYSNLFLFLLIPAILFSQSKNDNTVVGTVADQKITYGELKNNFTGGNTSELTLEELESFLPIYLDYKAKLIAAKEEGYYQDSELIEEHKDYAKQAAFAFWLEREIKPAALDEFERRSNMELKPFHILIAAGSNASEQEVNEAIAKLNEAKTEIQNGVPLEEVNSKYSSVRGGRSMGGDIPWISAGRTVQEFEDVIYNLEVGEISEPFRTQFGYHIVLLQDKREKTPGRLTKHIYVRDSGDSTSYDKIHEAYDKLENGEGWEKVLREYTEDGASARNQGNIGWVSYQGNFAMDFVDAIVRLDTDLPYSEPVKTNYGYHIFKIDSVETYQSKEKRREALLKNLKNTPYYEESNQFAIKFLKDKYSAQNSPEVLAEYKDWITQFDTTSINEIPSPVSILTKKVYEFNGENFSVADLHEYVTGNYPDRKATDFRDSWYNNFTNNVVNENIIELTVENYPEFEQQSNNYLDGLVIYNINEDHIWSTATVDSARLKTIYEKNIDEYTFPKRPYYYLITAHHDSTLDKAIAFVENGGSPDSLRNNVKRLGVTSDSTTSFTQEPFDMLAGMEPKSFSDKFDYNRLRAVFWLEEFLPSRQMSFEEAFNRVFATFQPQREQEWLDELRSKYKVKPNFKKLRSAFQKDS